MAGEALSRRLVRPATVALVDQPDGSVEGVPGGGAGGVVGTIYLAPLPDGPAVVLRGASAVIYREVTAGGQDPLAARIARALGVPVDSVQQDVVDAFVSELLAAGLLAEP